MVAKQPRILAATQDYLRPIGLPHAPGTPGTPPAAAHVQRASSRAAADEAFENAALIVKGWVTLVITVCSVALQNLTQPQYLLFWNCPERVLEPTNTPGVLVALLFSAYLLGDSLFVILYRARLRRPMGPVLLHHVVVGLGVAAYIYPSPPRAFFVYVWGEVLTACRVLPPAYRFSGRSVAFGLRRCTWLYVFARDAYSHRLLRARYGLAPAAIAPLLALLLLKLDHGWWHEHTQAGKAAALAAEAGGLLGSKGQGAGGASRASNAEQRSRAAPRRSRSPRTPASGAGAAADGRSNGVTRRKSPRRGSPEWRKLAASAVLQ